MCSLTSLCASAFKPKCSVYIGKDCFGFQNEPGTVIFQNNSPWNEKKYLIAREPWLCLRLLLFSTVTNNIAWQYWIYSLAFVFGHLCWDLSFHPSFAHAVKAVPVKGTSKQLLKRKGTISSGDIGSHQLCEKDDIAVEENNAGPLLCAKQRTRFHFAAHWTWGERMIQGS